MYLSHRRFFLVLKIQDVYLSELDSQIIIYLELLYTDILFPALQHGFNYYVVYV